MTTTMRLLSIAVSGNGVYDVLFETAEKRTLAFVFQVDSQDAIDVVISPQVFADSFDLDVSPFLRKPIFEAILAFHRACVVQLGQSEVLE